MSDKEAVDQLRNSYEQFFNEIRKVIIGQDEVVKEVLISIFSRGHCLLVGVPGLAKTLLVTTIAKILGLDFKRIQFTPDLMPSDIIGTEILDSNRVFRFVKGPLFAHMILADEINRTPPKTQSALLEAMQEKSVTSGGIRYQLEDPFFVLATQNPIEQEGTYPLPEAQLDRFMLNILLDYPKVEDEIDIVRRTTSDEISDLNQAISREEILFYQGLIRRVPVNRSV
ncbi:MAG: AAA family ATPase, partial [Bacteroidales bacterium]|nr:AAA family ATPase [Bacteroidales bacterium]